MPTTASSKKPERNLVIIPTYCEAENIAAIIERVASLGDDYDVLIIDDASPDGTAEIVRTLQSSHPAGRINMIERTGKLGLGTAYITGFRWALDHDEYGYIFEMDADFSHNPDDLNRLRSACADEGYDMSVGSRYVSGVNVINWPIGRVLMSYYASAYVRIVTRMPVRDATAGFVCYTRRLLAAYNFDAIRFKGYAFQIEMKYTALQTGHTIKEVPIVFTNRVLGESKMSKGIFSEGFFGVLRLKWNSLTGNIKRQGHARKAID